MDTWSITKILNWTTQYFKDHGIEWPHLEAEILLAHALNVKRIQLYIQHVKVLNNEELAYCKGLIGRRIKHEPIAYITGYQPFMGIDFIVTPDVLIPRPETEKLVEIAIDISRFTFHDSPFTIVDVGTGSGAIAVSLAKFIPQAMIIGIDLSSAALEVAKQNAQKHNVTDRCQFMQGNLLDPLKAMEKVDLIISNPPYIPTKDIPTLMADVKDYEPHSALAGGDDGLDYIRQLLEQAPKLLTANGLLLLEFGFGQAETINDYAKDKFSEIKIIKDNAGIDRIFWGKSRNYSPSNWV